MVEKKLQHGILRLATDVVRFGQSPIRNVLAAALELEINRLNIEVYGEHLQPEDKEHFQQAIVKWTKIVQEYANEL